MAIASNTLDYAFGDRAKLLYLTPELKGVPLGIISRKGRLISAAEKFCECAREAFKAAR